MSNTKFPVGSRVLVPAVVKIEPDPGRNVFVEHSGVCITSFPVPPSMLRMADDPAERERADANEAACGEYRHALERVSFMAADLAGEDMEAVRIVRLGKLRHFIMEVLENRVRGAHYASALPPAAAAVSPADALDTLRAEATALRAEVERLTLDHNDALIKQRLEDLNEGHDRLCRQWVFDQQNLQAETLRQLESCSATTGVLTARAEKAEAERDAAIAAKEKAERERDEARAGATVADKVYRLHVSRADAAEKACAEMRACIQGVSGTGDMALAHKLTDAMLRRTDVGTGYVTKEEADGLRQRIAELEGRHA